MNNKIKLIPRKLIGGLIPKFKNPYESLKKTIYKKGNFYHAKDINGRDIQLTTQTANKILKERRDLQYKIMTDPNTSLVQKAAAASLYYRDRGNVELANKNARNMYKLSRILSTTKPADKPANQNSGIKGGGRKSDDGSKSTDRTSTITGKTATTPVSTTTSVPTSGNYTIQRGDTLSKLAQQYGTTVDELAKLNNISNVNRIYAGLNLILPGQLTGETVKAKPLTETFSDPTTKKSPTPYEHWYNQGGRLAYENDLINNAFKTYDGSSLNDFTHIKNLETTQPKSLPNLNLQLDIPNILLLNPELENRYRAYSKRFTFARKGTKLIPRNGNIK